MKKTSWLCMTVFMNVGMVFGASDAVVARTIAEQKISPHEHAVDDMYKLTMKGVCSYKQFQAKAASLTVEQMYERLKGYNAAELHKVNDERLARYKEVFDRDPKWAALAKHKQDRTVKYLSPSVRFAEYSTDEFLKYVVLSLSVAGGLTTLGMDRVSRFVFVIFFLSSACIVVPQESRYPYYTYCNELIDHARRKELIDKMCRKTVS